MALDFNVLTQVPTFGERFMAGRQAAQEEAQRNMLLQQRQMEFQQSQEDRRLAAEERQRKAAQLEADRGRRQTFLAGLQQQMAQNGYRLDRKTLADVLTEGMQTGESNLVQLATKGLQALDDEDAWRSAFGGGAPAGAAPAAMPTSAAPQLGAPLTDAEDVSRANALGRSDPRFAMATPVGEYPAEPPAPVANAMVAPPADAERQRLNALLNNPSKAIRDEARERLKMMDAAGPRPIAVGGRLLSPTGQVIYEPPPGAMTPAERFVPVGPNVFNRETGQFLPGPTRAAAPAPEARAKPAAPIRMRPGEVLLSPETGQPIYTAPPAPARAPATQKEGAKPAEKPANVTEQQASTATQRLLNRATEIADIVQRNQKAEAPTMTEAAMENIPYLSRATNLVRSTDRQIVSSAQDDILDALLYLSTGAAYNKEQLQQQKSAYLPSWSDDPPTRQVKRQRLAQAIEGARVRAGRAWTPELDAAMQRLMEVPVMGGRAPAPTSAPAPAAAPAPARAPAPAAARRREIALGVFVTERP